MFGFFFSVVGLKMRQMEDIFVIKTLRPLSSLSLFSHAVQCGKRAPLDTHPPSLPSPPIFQLIISLCLSRQRSSYSLLCLQDGAPHHTRLLLAQTTERTASLA